MENKICFYAPPFPKIQSQYDMIDIAAEYGLSAIEGFCNFELTTPNIDEAKKIRDYADERGIVFPCFSVFVDVTGKDSCSAIETLKGYVNVAKILGSPYLHHTIVPEHRNPKNVIPYKKNYYDKGIESVKKIYDYAESIGIKTIYEPQGYIFNGIEVFGNFLEDVNREIGIVADFGNIYQSGDNITDFVKTFSHKICHAHLKDVLLNCNEHDESALEILTGGYLKTTDFGMGCVDFKGATKILKDSGYNGYYAIEHCSTDNNSKVIDDAIEFIEQLLG